MFCLGSEYFIEESRSESFIIDKGLFLTFSGLTRMLTKLIQDSTLEIYINL